MQIIWSPRSLRDVESIRDYIARDSPRIADLVVRRIVKSVEGLDSSPSYAGFLPSRSVHRSALVSNRPRTRHRAPHNARPLRARYPLSTKAAH